jgi:hypothetical protein
MAIKTTLEQIEEVQTAIEAVMSGQAYRVGNITYTRASLDALTKRESMLLSRYNREQGNSPYVSRARFADASYRNQGGDDDRRTC